MNNRLFAIAEIAKDRQAQIRIEARARAACRASSGQGQLSQPPALRLTAASSKGGAWRPVRGQ